MEALGYFLICLPLIMLYFIIAKIEGFKVASIIYGLVAITYGFSYLCVYIGYNLINA